MRQNVIQAVEKEKIIAIVRNVSKNKLIPFAEAMYKGGIRLLEITYSANCSVSDEDTAKCIEMLSKHFDGDMLIGAGTVLSEKQVALTSAAGGKFIISPNTDASVIKKTRELGLVSMPGALTPTEIMTSANAGADFVKLFPITNLGVSYVKAIRAPLSNVKLLAVGGIDENNMKDYLDAGVCGFGVGSNIVNKKMIEENDFEGLVLLAQKYINALKSI